MARIDNLNPGVIAPPPLPPSLTERPRGGAFGASVSRRARGAVRAGAVPYALLALVVGAVVLYPSAQLVWRSFHIGATGAVTWEPYRVLVEDARTRTALLNTLVTGGLSTLLCAVIGVALAWLTVRTDLPGARFFRVAFVLPFYIPAFIGAIAWLQIIGPVGYFNQAYKAITGGPDPLFRPYGPGGIVFLLALHHYPLVYLPVAAALDRFQPVLEDAARVAGAGSRRLLWDISLPLLGPGILAGSFLAFVTNVADFGIPAVMGIQARYYVLTTRIYQVALDSSMRNNLAFAAAQGMLLVAIAAVALAAQARALRGRRYSLAGAQGRGVDRAPLGAWRGPVTALAVLVVFVVLIAPVAATALAALTRVPGYPPTPDNLSLDNFRIAFIENAATGRALRNSLALAAASATIIAVLGFAVAYARQRTTLPGSGLLELVATVPYAVPGTVVALAFILAFARPVFGVGVYNTIWLILLAYLARFLTFGIAAAGAALRSVSETLPAAARMSGASWWQAQRDTVFPLVRGALLGGWLLVFVPCLAELTVSALLYSAGNETVGVAVFNLLETGIVAPAAALALTLMLIALGGSTLAQWLTRPRT